MNAKLDAWLVRLEEVLERLHALRQEVGGVPGPLGARHHQKLAAAGRRPDIRVAGERVSR